MAEPRVQNVTFTNKVTGTVNRVHVRKNRTYDETRAQLGRLVGLLRDTGTISTERDSRVARIYAQTINAMGLQGRIPGYSPYNFVLNRKNNRL